GTCLIHHAEFSGRRTKCDELLTHDRKPGRRRPGAQLCAMDDGQPILPHELAHGRIASALRELPVLILVDHGDVSGWRALLHLSLANYPRARAYTEATFLDGGITFGSMMFVTSEITSRFQIPQPLQRSEDDGGTAVSDAEQPRRMRRRLVLTPCFSQGDLQSAGIVPH